MYNIGRTHFQNLALQCCKIFKLCLAIVTNRRKAILYALITQNLQSFFFSFFFFLKQVNSLIKTMDLKLKESE